MREEKVGRAGIQLPSGLRPYSSEIKEIYEEEGVEALFLSNNCYGACSVADKKANDLGCDVLVHYGHATMDIPTSIPTLYVEARAEVGSLDPLGEILSRLEGSRWGLTATVQHLDYLELAEEYLRKNGVETVVGEPGPRSKYPGHILGCDLGAADSVEEEVDGFLYFGSGKFHPLGIALKTDKPVFSLNPISGDFEPVDLDLDEFLKKRYAMIEKAKSAERFGILVSTMRGQSRLGLAFDLAGDLEKGGYETFVLVMENFDPSATKGYQMDAFVNTACSRIPYDDHSLYEGPILTPYEVGVLLGLERWGDYELDEMDAGY